jgi:hypothetical protein
MALTPPPLLIKGKISNRKSDNFRRLCQCTPYVSAPNLHKDVLIAAGIDEEHIYQDSVFHSVHERL